MLGAFTLDLSVSALPPQPEAILDSAGLARITGSCVAQSLKS